MPSRALPLFRPKRLMPRPWAPQSTREASLTETTSLKPDGATWAYHREGRLLVCHRGTDAVQTINRGIADVSRLAKSTNPNATPAPKVTDVVSVHDLEARSCHELYIYRLDYRPRSAPSVGNVVAFSEPRFAAWRTDRGGDRLFGVGDLVNCGPHSAETIDWRERRYCGGRTGLSRHAPC